MTEHEGSSIVHLSYDVTLARSTRILDDMQDVTAVNCTSERLYLELIPGSDPDLFSREFRVGSVVAGGREWGCRSLSNLKAMPFFRKVKGLLSVNRNRTAPHLVLATSDCEVFDAFEKQEIEIWSKTKRSDLNAQIRRFDSSEPNTRTNFIDVDEGPGTVSEHFVNEILLEQTDQAKVSLEYDVDAQFSFYFKIRAGFESGKPKLFEFESWIDERIQFSYKAKAEVTDVYSIHPSLARQRLLSDIPIISVPLAIANVGVEIGLFGNLDMILQASVDAHFSVEMGLAVSRRRKNGARWDLDRQIMIPINEVDPCNTSESLDWHGKVVAAISPSVEFQVALKFGMGLGLFELGFELSSGIELYLEGSFEYGVGSHILKPLSLDVSPDCHTWHEAEARVDAGVRSLEVRLTVNPFGSFTLVNPQDLVKVGRVKCFESAGVDDEESDVPDVGKACGPFSEISHGVAIPIGGVQSGRRVVIRCENGYDVSGDASFLCRDGEYQIVRMPSCIPHSCGSLIVQNGISLSATDMVFGDKASIICNPGYCTLGEMQAECTAYGFYRSWICIECTSNYGSLGSGSYLSFRQWRQALQPPLLVGIPKDVDGTVSEWTLRRNYHQGNTLYGELYIDGAYVCETMEPYDEDDSTSLLPVFQEWSIMFDQVRIGEDFVKFSEMRSSVSLSFVPDGAPTSTQIVVTSLSKNERVEFSFSNTMNQILLLIGNADYYKLTTIPLEEVNTLTTATVGFVHGFPWEIRDDVCGGGGFVDARTCKKPCSSCSTDCSLHSSKKVCGGCTRRCQDSDSMRNHCSVDLLAAAGHDIVAPFEGKIVMAGSTSYNSAIQQIYIEASEHSPFKGMTAQLLYVTPNVAEGDLVKSGDIVGTVQRLSDFYSCAQIKNHVHMVLHNSNDYDTYLDPTDYLLSDEPAHASPHDVSKSTSDPERRRINDRNVIDQLLDSTSKRSFNPEHDQIGELKSEAKRWRTQLTKQYSTGFSSDLVNSFNQMYSWRHQLLRKLAALSREFADDGHAIRSLNAVKTWIVGLPKHDFYGLARAFETADSLSDRAREVQDAASHEQRTWAIFAQSIKRFRPQTSLDGQMRHSDRLELLSVIRQYDPKSSTARMVSDGRREFAQLFTEMSETLNDGAKGRLQNLKSSVSTVTSAARSFELQSTGVPNVLHYILDVFSSSLRKAQDDLETLGSSFDVELLDIRDKILHAFDKIITASALQGANSLESIFFPIIKTCELVQSRLNKIKSCVTSVIDLQKHLEPALGVLEDDIANKIEDSVKWVGHQINKLIESLDEKAQKTPAAALLDLLSDLGSLSSGFKGTDGDSKLHKALASLRDIFEVVERLREGSDDFVGKSLAGNVKTMTNLLRDYLSSLESQLIEGIEAEFDKTSHFIGSIENFQNLTTWSDQGLRGMKKELREKLNQMLRVDLVIMEKVLQSIKALQKVTVNVQRVLNQTVVSDVFLFAKILPSRADDFLQLVDEITTVQDKLIDLFPTMQLPLDHNNLAERLQFLEHVIKEPSSEAQEIYQAMDEVLSAGESRALKLRDIQPLFEIWIDDLIAPLACLDIISGPIHSGSVEFEHVWAAVTGKQSMMTNSLNLEAVCQKISLGSAKIQPWARKLLLQQACAMRRPGASFGTQVEEAVVNAAARVRKKLGYHASIVPVLKSQLSRSGMMQDLGNVTDISSVESLVSQLSTSAINAAIGQVCEAYHVPFCFSPRHVRLNHTNLLTLHQQGLAPFDVEARKVLDLVDTADILSSLHSDMGLVLTLVTSMCTMIRDSVSLTATLGVLVISLCEIEFLPRREFPNIRSVRVREQGREFPESLESDSILSLSQIVASDGSVHRAMSPNHLPRNLTLDNVGLCKLVKHAQIDIRQRKTQGFLAAYIFNRTSRSELPHFDLIVVVVGTNETIDEELVDKHTQVIKEYMLDSISNANRHHQRKQLGIPSPLYEYPLWNTAYECKRGSDTAYCNTFIDSVLKVIFDVDYAPAKSIFFTGHGNAGAVAGLALLSAKHMSKAPANSLSLFGFLFAAPGIADLAQHHGLPVNPVSGEFQNFVMRGDLISYSDHHVGDLCLFGEVVCPENDLNQCFMDSTDQHSIDAVLNVLQSSSKFLCINSDIPLSPFAMLLDSTLHDELVPDASFVLPISREKLWESRILQAPAELEEGFSLIVSRQSKSSSLHEDLDGIEKYLVYYDKVLALTGDKNNFISASSRAITQPISDGLNELQSFFHGAGMFSEVLKSIDQKSLGFSGKLQSLFETLNSADQTVLAVPENIKSFLDNVQKNFGIMDDAARFATEARSLFTSFQEEIARATSVITMSAGSVQRPKAPNWRDSAVCKTGAGDQGYCVWVHERSTALYKNMFPWSFLEFNEIAGPRWTLPGLYDKYSVRSACVLNTVPGDGSRVKHMLLTMAATLLKKRQSFPSLFVVLDDQGDLVKILVLRDQDGNNLVGGVEAVAIVDDVVWTVDRDARSLVGFETSEIQASLSNSAQETLQVKYSQQIPVKCTMLLWDQIKNLLWVGSGSEERSDGNGKIAVAFDDGSFHRERTRPFLIVRYVVQLGKHISGFAIFRQLGGVYLALARCSPDSIPCSIDFHALRCGSEEESESQESGKSVERDSWETCEPEDKVDVSQTYPEYPELLIHVEDLRGFKVPNWDLTTKKTFRRSVRVPFGLAGISPMDASSMLVWFDSATDEKVQISESMKAESEDRIFHMEIPVMRSKMPDIFANTYSLEVEGRIVKDGCLFGNFDWCNGISRRRRDFKRLNREWDFVADDCLSAERQLIAPKNTEVIKPKSWGPFMVGPVPITFSFGADAVHGLSLVGSVCFTAQTVSAALVPYHAIEVYFRGYIDLVFAQAGIELLGIFFQGFLELPLATYQIAGSKAPESLKLEIVATVTPLIIQLNAFYRLWLCLEWCKAGWFCCYPCGLKWCPKQYITLAEIRPIGDQKIILFSLPLIKAKGLRPPSVPMIRGRQSSASTAIIEWSGRNEEGKTARVADHQVCMFLDRGNGALIECKRTGSGESYIFEGMNIPHNAPLLITVTKEGVNGKSSSRSSFFTWDAQAPQIKSLKVWSAFHGIYISEHDSVRGYFLDNPCIDSVDGHGLAHVCVAVSRRSGPIPFTFVVGEEGPDNGVLNVSAVVIPEDRVQREYALQRETYQNLQFTGLVNTGPAVRRAIGKEFHSTIPLDQISEGSYCRIVVRTEDVLGNVGFEHSIPLLIDSSRIQLEGNASVFIDALDSSFVKKNWIEAQATRAQRSISGVASITFGAFSWPSMKEIARKETWAGVRRHYFANLPVQHGEKFVFFCEVRSFSNETSTHFSPVYQADYHDPICSNEMNDVDPATMKRDEDVEYLNSIIEFVASCNCTDYPAGIRQLEACVGTRQFACDVISRTVVEITTNGDIRLQVDRPLPSGLRLFVCGFWLDNAGRRSQRCSNGVVKVSLHPYCVPALFQVRSLVGSSVVGVNDSFTLSCDECAWCPESHIVRGNLVIKRTTDSKFGFNQKELTVISLLHSYTGYFRAQDFDLRHGDVLEVSIEFENAVGVQVLCVADPLLTGNE